MTSNSVENRVILNLEPIPRERVPHMWSELVEMLRPQAEKVGGKFSELDLWAGLTSGKYEAARCSAQNATGILVLEAGIAPDGVNCCYINYAGGALDLPPKQWLSVVRHLVDRIALSAREHGCTELRMAGRPWGRHIFNDWEPLPALPNGIRKRLV